MYKLLNNCIGSLKCTFKREGGVVGAGMGVKQTALWVLELASPGQPAASGLQAVHLINK